MGSAFEYQVVHECSKPVSDKLHKDIYQILSALEKELSLYDTNSAISRLNRNGQIQDVSMHFSHLVEQSKLFYKLTNGVFNITVQSILNNKNPEAINARKLKHQLDPEKIIIKKNKISFLDSKMQITLDGIAKGYAVDLIDASIFSAGYKNYLVNFSGNMVWRGVNLEGKPWRIFSWDNQTKTLKPIDSTKHRAIASSGNEHRDSHIYDPVKYKFVKKAGTTSVLCANAMTADVMSTVLFINPEFKIPGCNLVVH